MKKYFLIGAWFLFTCSSCNSPIKNSEENATNSTDTLVNETGRLLPRKLRGIPFGIIAAHTPNPCYAEFENGHYVWKHNTTVMTNEDLQVVEYGSFVYTSGGWYLRVTYSPKEFDEHYGTTNGLLEKGVVYTDPASWRMSDSLFAGDAMWFYIAKDKNGKLYKGIAPIETEGITLSEHNRALGFSKISPTKSSMKWTGYGEVGDYSLSGDIRLQNGIYKLKNDSLQEMELVIDMKTIDSDNKNLKEHLCNADFFNVTAFPTAKFVLTEPIALKGANLMAKGQLTVKETTQAVTIPFTYKNTNGVLSLSGKASIDRTQFNIRYGSKSFFDNLGDQAIKNTFDLVFALQGE